MWNSVLEQSMLACSDQLWDIRWSPKPHTACIPCVATLAIAQDQQRLIENGWEPERRRSGSQVTYNTLIDVYGKLGRWEDALQVLLRMKTQVSN